MDSGNKPFFGSGLKKLKKKDPITISLLRTLQELIGSMFMFGKIGTGKTVSMLSLAGLYHDNPQRKYKIIDIWGGDRNEHLYWGLPSNQIKYWNYVKKTLKLDKDGPKQYQVTYYYPLMKKLRNNLPFNPPFVTSKIFTIPIRDITHTDFALITGKVGENSAAHWKNVINESKKNDSASKIVNNYRKKISKNNAIYNSILHPLINEGILQEDNCQFNFDIKKIAEMLDDQETISVFSLDFVDEEYKLFIIGYIIRKITEALDKKRRETIEIIREASKFFKVTDQSIVPDRYKVMKSYLSDWIRMGRRGFHPFLDTQSPSETSGLLDGQQDMTLLGKMPGMKDREMATFQLIRDGLMDPDIQRPKIANLNPGQFCFCPSGEKVSFNYLLLPKCRYWQEGNGNFYDNIWGKEVTKWINFDKEREDLMNKLKDDSELIKEENIKDKKGSKLINVKEIGIVKNIIEISENLNQNSPPINLNVEQKIQTIKKVKKYRGFQW